MIKVHASVSAARAELPFPDNYAADNYTHCLSTCFALGVEVHHEVRCLVESDHWIEGVHAKWNALKQQHPIPHRPMVAVDLFRNNFQRLIFRYGFLGLPESTSRYQQQPFWNTLFILQGRETPDDTFGHDSPDSEMSDQRVRNFKRHQWHACLLHAAMNIVIKRIKREASFVYVCGRMVMKWEEYLAFPETKSTATSTKLIRWTINPPSEPLNQ